MNIFLYAKRMEGPGRKLHSVIASLAGPDEIEVFTTIADLARRLYPFGHADRTAVFLTTDRDELLEVFSIANMLQQLRSILVLPDRKPDTLKIGYLLRPRFISYADSGFFEVQAVLRQIRKNAVKGIAPYADNEDEAGMIDASFVFSRNGAFADDMTRQQGRFAAL